MLRLPTLSQFIFSFLIIFSASLLSAQNMLENGIGRLSFIGCGITGSEIRITGTGNFHANKAYLASETTLEEIDMNFKIRVDSLNAAGQFLYAIGKSSPIAGTMIEISGTDTSSKIVIDKLNSLTPTYVTQYTLPFTIDTGDVYTVRVGKRVRNLVVEIYNSDSTNYFYIDSLAYPTPFWGCLWGTPFIGGNKGSFAVTDFTMTTPFNLSPRLTVWGDSFIEGNSLGDVHDRYIQYLQDSITHDNVTIIGRGGESSVMLASRFPRESRWFKNSKYALLAIGVNDVNFTTWKNNMQNYIDTLKKNDVVPIIVTLTPRSDRLPFIAAVNNWVRTTYNGLYIDVANAVSSGTTWFPGMVMSDNVHPTVAGHDTIWKRIQIEAPYLFRSDSPYTVDFLNETTMETLGDSVEYSTLSSFASSSVGSFGTIPVVPGEEVFFRDTAAVHPVVNAFSYILLPPRRPAAPTVPVIDMGMGTFDWTYNPLFTNYTDYEYSLDSVTWLPCVSKPIYSPATADLQLRVKATVSNFKGEILYFDTTGTTTGIAAYDNVNEPAAYPNPFNELIFIKELKEKALLTIYSADGRKVASQQLEEGTNAVSTSQLDAGVYFLNISGEKINSNLKMLKR
jgi:lysophospholipase L1-like esterase